jgi:hypothetical protein
MLTNAKATWNLMEVCNVHVSVSNQHPCFLTNVKDKKAIRLAIII